MKFFFSALAILCSVWQFAFAQQIEHNPGSNHGNKFEQLGILLPAPNEEHTASGAPGDKYWQQQVDYNIKCELDEKNLMLTGAETITYHNNSHNTLDYVWVRLDENQSNNIVNANYPGSTAMPQNGISVQRLNLIENNKHDNGYGIKIEQIKDAGGHTLIYNINKTMMRVDLPGPLKPGQQFIFNISWHYKLLNRGINGGRGGYEYFPEDRQYLFTMAQWYPRLCVFSDFQGWQTHQFTDMGEFALAFGNFHVQLTVPANHTVGATGECLNYNSVLSAEHLLRYQNAKKSNTPIEIITLAEAKKAQVNPAQEKKTWIFEANNVRDFAWTSSPRFIWDGMGIEVGGKKVICMSFYGPEAYGLYSRFSTRVLAHTIKTYSDFAFPYPYPVAQSVEAANGAEFPMIAFNFGRTEADGTYSEELKNSSIQWSIHSEGHNYFPEIINSDESQWTWMDKGINSFVQNLTEELWDNKFPGTNAAYTIVDYMKQPKDKLEPIMTNSENIRSFISNAYHKPAVALNILRETILGRKAFDYAFKEYAKRWAFKHPTPADFFRTMNDATGEDLDWFWRGWFFGTDACDISLDSVRIGRTDVNTLPKFANQSLLPKLPLPYVNDTDDLSKIRNREDKSISFYADKDTAVQDFYWRYDRGLVKADTSKFNAFVKSHVSSKQPGQLDKDEKVKFANKYFYELNFSNKGGLVMPIIVEFTFTDGSKEIDRIPVEIWRLNEKNVSKLYLQDKEVASIRLDPYRETADIDETNNYWSKSPAIIKIPVFKSPKTSAPINLMQVSASGK